MLGSLKAYLDIFAPITTEFYEHPNLLKREIVRYDCTVQAVFKWMNCDVGGAI